MDAYRRKVRQSTTAALLIPKSAALVRQQGETTMDEVTKQRVREYRARLAAAEQEYPGACVAFMDAKLAVSDAHKECNRREAYCEKLAGDIEALRDSIKQFGG